MPLVLKSEQQILSDQIARFKAETGVTDFNPGSVILTLLQAATSEDFQQYIQMLNIIRNFNLDTTTGQDLDNKAFEFGLFRNNALEATGKVTILRESTFVKVASSISSGSPAPLAGDTVLRVDDASDPLYGTSGTLIVGRGAANEEEVTYAIAPVDFTNFFEFTVSPFSNDHGLDETVILKQGVDESIDSGTSLIIPATASSPEVQFTVDEDVVLLAGEADLQNVEVTATLPGAIGNIPINAINGEKAFSNPPFTGARAQNDFRFTTGVNQEVDDDLRDRIKQTIQSLSRGVKTAILNAIIGLVEPDSAKRVVSASVILPQNLQEIVKIFIDDGTGFEPNFESQGFESIITEATGGETRLQLDLIPLVKAQIETSNQEPYNMSSGSLSLNYTVGIDSETINFGVEDFLFPESGTAEEIVTAINNKAFLIEARTSAVGKAIVITSKEDENEDIQVTGGSSNSILQFPTDQRSTLFLYVDDVLFTKDGITAFVDTGNIQPYNFSVLAPGPAGPWPLNIIVDGKGAPNDQVVEFVPADFNNPASGTAIEVAAAINIRLAGATATTIDNDTKVRLASNTDLSALSKIEVTGGSANTTLGFSTTEIVGKNKDYTLNKQLGTIELTTPLAANQSVTAGSQFTRAFLRSLFPEIYSITIAETLVISIDGAANQTVTFPSTGLFTAAQIITEINSQLEGGTATIRKVGSQNFVEITTNTYDETIGSIRIDSSSTAIALAFVFNTTVINQRPHTASVTSGAAGPYTFLENDRLIVVMDNDPITKTFSVIMDQDGTVTSGTSTTIFANLAFNTTFTNDDELNDFFVVFKSGANSTSGIATDITDQGGNTFRYLFSALPTNLVDFAVNDQVEISGMQNEANDGFFLITAVNTAGNGFIEITNVAGIIETGSTGTTDIGQRRQVTDYVGTTGVITVGVALRAIPSIGDTFIIIPSTTKNTVEYIANTKVTTLGTKAIIESVELATKVQISSREEGSAGFVQVTGGLANLKLLFSTTIIRGLQGYEFFTGLTKLVHSTVYGDDRDLVASPGVGAAGIQFEIKAPTVQEITFDIDVTLAEGVSIVNVRDDITSEITGYVNNLGIGNDVIIAEAIERIMGVTNIVDVEIVNPSSNTPIADNELARTRNSLITIG